MRTRITIAIVLTMMLCFGAHEAPADDDLLDIIVSTTLKTTPEHQAAYRQDLGSLAVSSLSELSPRNYEADEQPKNGAARYRLVIEHDGVITLGNALSATHGHPLINVETTATGLKVTRDVSRWESHWYLKVQERGRLTYTIQEWTGDAYRKVSTWSANMPPSPVVEGMAGRIEVASTVQTTDGKYDRSPPCPVTVEEAKEAALAKLLPSLEAMDEAINRDFMAGIVEARMLTAAPDPNGGGGAGGGLGGGLGSPAKGTFQIINRSPWPIKSLSLVGYVTMKPVAGAGFAPALPKGTGSVPHVFMAMHAFDKPLEPGKTATVTVNGNLAVPLGVDARKLPPTKVADISFSLKP